MATEQDGPTTGETFAALLRRHRVAAALSQQALAERAGLSTRAISDLERGVKQRPYLETVRLIADALELDVDERAGLAGAAHPPLGVVQRSSCLSTGEEQVQSALPMPPTPLIGRDAEVALIGSMLRDPGVRLVTLTGPGGIGKTRLALQVARTLEDAFDDGVHYVGLADVADPDLVAASIARSLGVTVVGDDPAVVRLQAFLAGKRLLLVLDNFEQVVTAGLVVAGLLSGAPDLKVLVTSRESLRVAGEREFEVLPLALPDADVTYAALPDQLAPAIQLFLERARGVSAGFALSPGNASVVVAICRRLDGLPLAIELAAARVKILSPEALLNRLERTLPLLTGGVRDLPARQQTMRNAIAWSFDLLSPEEQKLFRRLSVFAGGFTLEAAEAVSDGDADVLGGIASLADKSLLRLTQVSGSNPRYSMLETVREFGSEQLAYDREAHQTHRAHAAYYIALAEIGTALRSLPWLHYSVEIGSSPGSLATERDNLRAAFDWLLENDPPGCLRLAAACAPFWSLHEYVREGRTRLERALSATSSETTEVRARALLWAVSFAILSGDIEAGARWAREGCALWGALGDPRGHALALQLAGWVEEVAGRFEDAIELLQLASSLYGDLGESFHVASISMVLGGIQFWHNGDIAAAEAAEDVAAAIFRELGEDGWIANTNWYRGLFAGAQAKFDEAAHYYRESLRVSVEIGVTQLMCKALVGLAATAVECNLAEAAARLLGATEAALVRTGFELFPGDQPAYERATNGALTALGAQGFSAALIAGHKLSAPELLSLADAIVEATGGATTADKATA